MGMQFLNGPMLRFPANGLPLTQAAKSISFWINLANLTTPAVQSVINAIENDGGNFGYQVGVRNNGIIMVWQYGGGVVIAAPAAIAINTWVHFAYTFDGTTHRLYQNGVQVATATGVTMQTGAPVDIQIGNNFWNEALNGRIEDVRMYDRSLGANEVMTVYTLRGCDVIVLGLDGRWKLNEAGSGAVTEPIDESEYDRQCTVTGTPTYINSILHYKHKQT